jgi:hypothetical protein
VQKVVPLQGHVSRQQGRRLWPQITHQGKREPTRAEFEWFIESLDTDAFVDLITRAAEATST